MKNVFKKMTSKQWILIIVLILAGVSIFLFQKGNDVYDSYTVEKHTISDAIELAGTIDAERRADLGFAMGGRVAKIHAREGDFVKKGQVIAELDQNANRANYIQSQASYQVTKIETHAGEKKTNVSYEKTLEEQNKLVEELRKQYLSGDLEAVLLDDDPLLNRLTPPQISGSYLGLEEGKYKVHMYRSKSPTGYTYILSGLEDGIHTAEIYRPGKLGTKGLYIQFPSTDLYKYNNTDWEIRIPNKRSPTYLARKTAYEDAVKKRDKMIAELSVDKEKYDPKAGGTYVDAKLTDARARVQAQSARLQDGKIRAPFDGYVVKNDLELGEIVNAYTPLVVFFANSNKKLVLNTPEVYVNRLEEGKGVDITLDAYPDVHYQGKISSIDAVESLVDGVPVYKTDVAIVSPDEKVRVGMNAKAHIANIKKDNVIAIPAHFVYEKNGAKYVLLLTNKEKGETKEIEVDTGAKGNDGFVEIISGLKEGDVIVLPEEEK